MAHHGTWAPWLWYVGSVVVVHRLSCSEACGILVSGSGIEPGPTTMKVPNLNNWTAKEFSILF